MNLKIVLNHSAIFNFGMIQAIKKSPYEALGSTLFQIFLP